MRKGPAPRPLSDRFWAKVAHGEECWEWQGYLAPNGYGRFSIREGEIKLAHRMAWELINGPVPGDLCCLHRCDNRRCVRPDHLFLGTRVDNLEDMHAKGRNRQPRGSGHKFAKLTEEAVRNIRQRLAAGDGAVALAEEYGVTRGLIYNVKNRNCWTHV